MSTRLKADYLIVGTGAVGMAFVDSLIADSDARVQAGLQRYLTHVTAGLGKFEAMIAAAG